MNRLLLVAFPALLIACSSKVSLEEADALSSAKVARTSNCDAPLLVSREPARSGGDLRYIWRCKPQDDGSRRSLYADVSQTGDVDLKAMTVSVDDPVFEANVKNVDTDLEK